MTTEGAPDETVVWVPGMAVEGAPDETMVGAAPSSWPAATGHLSDVPETDVVEGATVEGATVEGAVVEGAAWVEAARKASTRARARISAWL